MLVELLRTSSRGGGGAEQLRKLAGDIEARGERRIGRAEPPSAQPCPKVTIIGDGAASSGRERGLVFLDTGIDFAASVPTASRFPADPDLVPPLEEWQIRSRR